MNQPDRALRVRLFFGFVWFAVVALYGVLVFLGTPAYWEHVTHFTGFVLTSGFSGGWESAAAFQSALSASGFPPGLYIGWTLLRDALGLVVNGAVGVVIFWRRGREFIGWYTSLMLVLFGLVFGSRISAPDYGPFWNQWLDFLIGVPWLAFYVFFYIFPNGRFVPHWTRFTALLVCLIILLGSFSTLMEQTAGPMVGGILILTFGLSVVSQVYRYYYVSTPVQRQQTKWPLWALIIMMVTLLIGVILIPLLFPIVRTDDPTRLVYDWTTGVMTGSATLLLPLGLGFAILRYRLWDIDILIRRTLQYSLITGLLGLVYFGTIILLQAILGQTTGERSPLVLVLSTLLIAALFAPLRRRVQNLIDRRFFRQKYDAAQVLAQFATVARDEVEMEKLAAALVHTIETTVQPEAVSVWLKPTPNPRRNSYAE